MRRKGLLFLTVIFFGGLILASLAPKPIQAKEKVIKLKLANYTPPHSKVTLVAEEFAKDLEERTQGRIKIEYFRGGSLLKGPGMYKGIETGVADIGYSHILYTSGRMPVTETCALPLGYPSAWVSTHAVNDFYFKFRPQEWNKVKILWFNACAPPMIMSKKPVRALEDLKGLTLRAPGVAGKVVKALGGTPAPTPMMETYDAVAKGVLDGVYAVYEALKGLRFAEVVHYTTVSWHVGATFPFYMAMNKNSYNSLPTDLKEIFDNLCGEYRERYALVWNEIEIEGKNFGVKKGMKFIELSEKETVFVIEKAAQKLNLPVWQLDHALWKYFSRPASQ